MPIYTNPQGVIVEIMSDGDLRVSYSNRSNSRYTSVQFMATFIGFAGEAHRQTIQDSLIFKRLADSHARTNALPGNNATGYFTRSYILGLLAEVQQEKLQQVARQKEEEKRTEALRIQQAQLAEQQRQAALRAQQETERKRQAQIAEQRRQAELQRQAQIAAQNEAQRKAVLRTQQEAERIRQVQIAAQQEQVRRQAEILRIQQEQEAALRVEEARQTEQRVLQQQLARRATLFPQQPVHQASENNVAVQAQERNEAEVLQLFQQMNL